MSVIKKCGCTCTGQDGLHGKGKRVFNKTGKTRGNDIVYRCTVCGKEKT